MVNFLKEYQELYGKENMTYNAHILVHMVHHVDKDHVDKWGAFVGLLCLSIRGNEWEAGGLGPWSVDTVACCMVMTQFNESYSCAWCQQEGVLVQKVRGHAPVFEVQEPAPKEGTQKNFARHVEEFPGSFLVDYMHAVCNGLVRSTAFMWFSHKRQSVFSLGPELEEINTRLSKMTPVWETNLTATLSERWEVLEGLGMEGLTSVISLQWC
ncbi:hypothetical protein MTO96_019994 [Rhipicephalus appendiculatus]